MKKNNFIPFFIVAVVLVPLMSAFFLYHNPQFLSGETTVRGNLLVPPLDARPLLGETGQWQLVLVADAGCSTECQETIYYVLQVHKALAKDKSRVASRLLTKGRLGAAAQELLQQRELEVVEITEERLRLVFPLSSFPNASLQNSIFVIDPHGNLMLEHQEVTNINAAKSLLKDLKKLLRASRIG